LRPSRCRPYQRFAGKAALAYRFRIRLSSQLWARSRDGIWLQPIPPVKQGYSNPEEPEFGAKDTKPKGFPT
jgi:hypothetical protein